MAQQIALSVYQINSMDPIPLASVTQIGFPTAGILVRGCDVTLDTGVRCYGQVQVAATGTQYLVRETTAQIVTASNAS